MIRQMSFNGIFAEDMGVFVERGVTTPPSPRIITESIPYRDGVYDFSRMDGTLHYDMRNLEYDFIAHENTPEETNEVIAEVTAWLYGSGAAVITDDHYDGWYFDGASLTGLSYEYCDTRRTVARIAAKFTAEPYMYAMAGFDPDISPPSYTSSSNSYSSVTYSSDDMVATLSYTIPSISGEIIAKFPLASCTIIGISTSATVASRGQSDKYAYIITTNGGGKTVTVTYQAPSGTTMRNIMTYAGTQWAIVIAYSSKYARARRL